MKVLLINPNFSLPPTPPIALDYLGDFLRKKNYCVDILDLFFCKNYQGQLDAYLNQNNVKAIGITIRNIDDCLFGSKKFYLPFIKTIIDLIKKSSDIPIILGGTGFSVMPEMIMEYCGADFGIQGDGEESLPTLLEAMEDKKQFPNVPNLIYKFGKTYIKNEVKYCDMNNFPLPSRSLVKNEVYFQRGVKGNVETKRGCNQDCIYCVDPISKGRNYRLRSPKSVIDEIELLYKKGINAFHICDSEFNLPEEHAKEICSEIIRRNLHKKITWETFANPIPFSEELAQLMKKTGCVHVEFGADSGNDRILESLEKNFRVKDLESTANICNKYRLKFTYDFLIGGPGETMNTLKETLRVIKKLPVQHLAFNIGVRVYPQTELSQYVLRQGPLEENRNLYGEKSNNENFFWPVYFISSELGEETINNLIEGIDGKRATYIKVLRGISKIN